MEEIKFLTAEIEKKRAIKKVARKELGGSLDQEWLDYTNKIISIQEKEIVMLIKIRAIVKERFNI